MKTAVKLLSIIVLLGLLFAVPAAADSDINEFVETYNYYANVNKAPLIDPAAVSFGSDGWEIVFDNSYALCVGFDKNGLADLLMLEAEAGNAQAKLAFLNAWYVIDADVVYTDINALADSLLGSRQSKVQLYNGWYLAYEFDPSTNGEYLGIVWVGDDKAAEPSASPSATPAPVAPAINGKPVYKA